MMSEKLYHLLYYVSAKSNSTQPRTAQHGQHSTAGLAVDCGHQRTQTHLHQMNNNNNALL